MIQLVKLTSILTILLLAFVGCKDKVTNPPQPNEEELITTVELTFTNVSNTNDVRVYRFSDTDGAGGSEPSVHDTIKLDSDSTYHLVVRFLDESGTNPIDITEEVKEEANEHLVCYSASGSISITVTDLDGNNLPLGLEATLSTQSAETTNLVLSLKHQPDIKNGSCDLGETDVEVDFRVEVG
jgi:hypothetical protein